MGGGERELSGPRLGPDHLSILALLDEADRPAHVNELAERLVRQDEPVMSDEEFADAVERKTISLHHNVLPRLAQLGELDYDPTSNTVSARADEGVDIDWLDEEGLAGGLSNLRPDDDAIGVIRGRRAAIEYGRALADEAEDELFCMYVGTDLLEDECIRRAEDAIDRGVELYMGSRDAEVRDLTRRHLPEATIWEPRRAWLDAPIGYPKVGRLVLVDRRHVMVAVLDEPDRDREHPEERAMVGAGETNPLVVLVRELLGPRLDHLDFQSADFQNQLHS